MIQAGTRRAELVEQALGSQRALMRALHESIVPEWLELDLSMSQLKALFVLLKQGPMPIGQLAGVLSIGKPAASLLVDGMVHLGLVDRVEDSVDRRRTLASPSARAQELVSQLRRGQRDRMESLLDRLTDEELQALARGLEAISRVIAEQSSIPPAAC